ncbi:helix-turn-helix domain-containing protein, partial [Thioalkalicoccus limnaeus]
WERLRGRRRELAAELGLAPYMVFNDVTLGEMVRYRPRTADELGGLTGVGAVKLERFGAAFLAVLAAHEAEHGRPADLPSLPETLYRPPPRPRPQDLGLTATVRETLDLVRAGLTLEDVAAHRGLKLVTIHGHLARGIEEGEIELRDAVALADDEIRTIQKAFAQLAPDAPEALKPVYDELQGRYDYGILRCVRAAMARALEKGGMA